MLSCIRHRVFLLLVLVPPPCIAAELEQAPNTWVKRSPLATTPPSPRLGYEGACAWDSENHLLIRYGGHNQGGGGAQYSEVWTFDLPTAQWTLKLPNTYPPGVCCAQQNVFATTSGQYIRFPAFSGSHGWQWFREIYLNNATVWLYDARANVWRNRHPLPTPRVSPLRCASWDCDAQVVVLFGGEGNQEGTVVYDPYTNTWTRMRPPAEPPFRSGGNMVYDVARKRHILFGAQFSDDPHTWAYDVRQNRWTDLEPGFQPPTDKNDAVMVYDAAGDVVVAIVRTTSGDNRTARLETWAFDGKSNTWSAMNPPREPDLSGNRARVLSYAPEFGLVVLENRTKSKPGPPEQQIWTYRSAAASAAKPPRLAPPKELAILTSPTGARLSWKEAPSPGVTHHVLHRGTQKSPGHVAYARIASIPAGTNSYEDTNLHPRTIYHYTVRAATGDHLSAGSAQARTQPAVIEDPVVSVLSPERAELRWERARSPDTLGYHVERAPVAVWSEEQLKRLRRGTPLLPEPAVGAITRVGTFERRTSTLIPASESSFTDTVALSSPHTVAGETSFNQSFHAEHLNRSGKPYRFAVYAYRIRAINALGVESGPSSVCLTIPSIPQHLFSREAGTSCRLKWSANPEKQIRGYHVYRIDGRWNKDAVTRLTEKPITGLTLTDATAGKESHRYHVVAVDALGQEGHPSAPVWYRREWERFYEPFVGDWHQ